MFRCRPISLLLIGLFLWVTACTSYTQIEPGEVADHAKVRVTLTDGEKTEMREPALDADSLRGRVKEVARIGGYRWSDSVVVIPLESVAEIAVGSNPASKYLIGTGVVLVALVLFGVVACAANSNDIC